MIQIVALFSVLSLVLAFVDSMSGHRAPGSRDWRAAPRDVPPLALDRVRDAYAAGRIDLATLEERVGFLVEHGFDESERGGMPWEVPPKPAVVAQAYATGATGAVGPPVELRGKDGPTGPAGPEADGAP